MNSNYLTQTKEFDYRFISRVLLSVFTTQELAAGCVRMDGSYTNNSIYQSLDAEKFGFVKGFLFFTKWNQIKLNYFINSHFSSFFKDLFHERVKGQKKRFAEIYKLVNAKCSSLRLKKGNWNLFKYILQAKRYVSLYIPNVNNIDIYIIHIDQ